MPSIRTAPASAKVSLALICSLVLFAVALLLPQNAFALSASEIYVNNASKSLYQAQQDGTAPSGVSFNESSQVLTLNNYNSGPIFVKSDNSRTLRVNVVGTNNITTTGASHMSHNLGLECWSDLQWNYCSINIAGTGSLTITVNKPYNNTALNAGIICGGDITIGGSVKLTVDARSTATTASSSSPLYGVYSDAGSLKTEGSAQVTIKCTTPNCGAFGAGVRLGSSGRVFAESSYGMDIDCRNASSASGSSFYGIQGGIQAGPLIIKNAPYAYVRAPLPFYGCKSGNGIIDGYQRVIWDYENGQTTLEYKKRIPLTSDMLKTTPPTAVYVDSPQQWRGMTLKYGSSTIIDVTGQTGDVSGFVRSYSDDCTNVGTVTITFTGVGLYTGSFSTTYQIVPRSISSMTMEDLSPSYKQGVMPWPTIRWTSSRTLVPGKEYTLSYENYTTVPTSDARVIAHGTGNFTGTLTGTFAIDHAYYPDVITIAGDYANETSALISEETFGNKDWVVIARDDDFADALGATGLAGTLYCPILLTDRTHLSEAAATEIERLGAKHAYIIGGTGAISTQVDADLEALGVEVEPHIWGENSYDTSLACAKEIEKLHGYSSDTVIIAMSTNFQDALSMSPYAYWYEIPIVLQTWGDTAADRGFTEEAQQWIVDRDLYIAGGEGAISSASIDTLMNCNVIKRLWGETGYDTSREIADYMVSNDILRANVAVLACGAQAPKGTDALAGAALAGKKRAPILLVNGNEAMEPSNFTTIEGFLDPYGWDVRTVYVLGGSYVMPQSVYDMIDWAFSPKG